MRRLQPGEQRGRRRRGGEGEGHCERLQLVLPPDAQREVENLPRKCLSSALFSAGLSKKPNMNKGGDRMFVLRSFFCRQLVGVRYRSRSSVDSREHRGLRGDLISFYLRVSSASQVKRSRNHTRPHRGDVTARKSDSAWIVEPTCRREGALRCVNSVKVQERVARRVEIRSLSQI